MAHCLAKHDFRHRSARIFALNYQKKFGRVPIVASLHIAVCIDSRPGCARFVEDEITVSRYLDPWACRLNGLVSARGFLSRRFS